jgi:phosphate uptake regulator
MLSEINEDVNKNKNIEERLDKLENMIKDLMSIFQNKDIKDNEIFNVLGKSCSL